MSAADKLLKKLRNNPRDWRIETLKTIASRHGIQHDQDGTSHVLFYAPSGKTLSVPSRKPIKPIYIKLFLKLIEG